MINHWWLILLAGFLLIGIGIWIIISPFQSYLALSWVFAIGMIGTGIFEILFSLVNYQSIKRWGWTFIAGIIDLMIGGYLLNNPLISMVLLHLIVGLWMLFRGITAIGDALHIRSYGFNDWKRLLFTAITIILLALLILACPIIGIENLILWTGLAFIVTGVFRIYLAFKLRSVKKDLNN